MPPTKHESTKHPQRGRRPESIDRFPKKNGSGIPDSSPFHKKYVVRPQIKFSDRPFFKRGRRVAGRGPAKSAKAGVALGVHRLVPENLRLRHSGFYTFQLKICCPPADKVFGSTPFSKGVAGCRAGSPAKSDGIQGGVLQGRLDCQAGALRRAPGIGGRRLWKECFLGGTHSFGSTA